MGMGGRALRGVPTSRQPQPREGRAVGPSSRPLASILETTLRAVTSEGTSRERVGRRGVSLGPNEPSRIVAAREPVGCSTPTEGLPSRTPAVSVAPREATRRRARSGSRITQATDSQGRNRSPGRSPLSTHLGASLPRVPVDAPPSRSPGSRRGVARESPAEAPTACRTSGRTPHGTAASPAPSGPVRDRGALATLAPSG